MANNYSAVTEALSSYEFDKAKYILSQSSFFDKYDDRRDYLDFYKWFPYWSHSASKTHYEQVKDFVLCMRDIMNKNKDKNAKKNKDLYYGIDDILNNAVDLGTFFTWEPHIWLSLIDIITITNIFF